MRDIKIIAFGGRPLFQTATMLSSVNSKNTFEDIACFLYVVQGKGTLIESNGTHTLKRHEGLVKSCGNFISSYLKDSEGNDFEAIAIYFYPDLIKEMYKEISGLLDRSFRAYPPQKIVSNALIEKFISGLQLYFEHEEMMDENLAKLKIRELIMILLKSNYYQNVVDLYNGLFSPQNRSFREVVENNVFSVVTLDEMAFLTNRSISTFKRDFKKEFAQTPAKYIKERRLEKAAASLAMSELSVTEVAFACGFQDLSTFSSVFKAKFSQSPSQYRLNQNRKSLS